MKSFSKKSHSALKEPQKDCGFQLLRSGVLLVEPNDAQNPISLIHDQGFYRRCGFLAAHAHVGLFFTKYALPFSVSDTGTWLLPLRNIAVPISTKSFAASLSA